MRVGLFGGTFNPPHLGHLILAQECLYQLKLNRIDWVLTPDPPHKDDPAILPVSDRIDLVEAAISRAPEFRLSRVEIDRQPPHYAVDTIRLLKQREPAVEWIYLMGGDSLHDLPSWHLPAEFVAACDGFGVVRRPGDSVDMPSLLEALPGLRGKISFVQAPLIEISSSEIRRRARLGLPIRYFVPEAVLNLIQSRHSYCQTT